MVDAEIVEAIRHILDTVEAGAQAKIDEPGRYYIEPRTGKNVYSHAIEAVWACRSAVNKVSLDQDELGYLDSVQAQLIEARQQYSDNADDDEDAYGRATFHTIINQVASFRESIFAVITYAEQQDSSIIELGPID